MSSTLEFVSKPLYGGAITMNLPSKFLDASNIRPVPDNQEVYLQHDGPACIITDITERVAAQTDQDAILTHLGDIVDVQEMPKIWASKTMTGLQQLPENTPVYTVLATTRQPGNTGDAFMALVVIIIRLEPQATDLLITVYVPHTPAEAATEHSVCAPDLAEQKGFINGQGWNESAAGPSLQAGMLMAIEAVKSIKIDDWSLFGSE